MISSHNYIKKQIAYVKAQINRLRTHVATQIVQASQVQGGGVPSGTIVPYLGTNMIAGYLACDGSAYNVDDYPTLYAILMTIDETIRTTWGDADWETTFNVPNLSGQFLRGVGAEELLGIHSEAGLPDITGEFLMMGNGSTQKFIAGGVGKGAFYTGSNTWGKVDAYTQAGNTNRSTGMFMAASRSNPIYGKSDTVMPDSVAVQYIIKT